MEQEQETKEISNVVYSPLYTFSGKSISYSPNGKFALFTYEKQVHVINTDTQYIDFTIYCSDRIDYAEWSPNSEYILCCVRRNNSIEVFLFKYQFEGFMCRFFP